MTKKIRSIDAPQYVGQEVHLQGWMSNLRRIGGVSFIVLRDGWGTIQAVSEDSEVLRSLDDVSLESVISLTGTLRASAQAQQGFELHLQTADVVSPVVETVPVAMHKKQLNATLHVLLDHAVITNRHPTRRAIFRLAASAMAGFRKTLNEQGFTEVQSPKIVASATESGSNVFQIDYFGTPAYLAQSPQFYKQIMVGVFERVYEVGPVFRAEPHDTSRHINEYVSLDVEFGFIDNHFTVMAMLGKVLDGILAELMTHNQAELDLLQVKLPARPETLPHIHFSDAQELIWQRHRVDVRGEPDLSPQDERWLGEWASAEYGSDYLFVTGYPMVKRPFYTHPDPARPAYSNSFDLLFRGTELVTGGQRLHRYDDYLSALARAGYPTEPFASYLEAFRYGMPPHGGFAIGLERLLMQLLGLPNVRQATLFPRDLARLSP